MFLLPNFQWNTHSVITLYKLKQDTKGEAYCAGSNSTGDLSKMYYFMTISLTGYHINIWGVF